MKPHTSNLFDHAKAQRAADTAASAAGHAEESWIQKAIQAITHCAATMETFTVDDVQARLSALAVTPPQEGRAMGAAMKRAVSAQIIVSTGRYAKSAQVQCHANPRTVWTRAQPGKDLT